MTETFRVVLVCVAAIPLALLIGLLVYRMLTVTEKDIYDHYH